MQVTEDRKENSEGLISHRWPVFFFLLFWFVLNLLQISFTELTSDEGYYWFYAHHLQWGYYDHPPMIAAMIKAGTVLFPGELGVRFFSVVFSTAGLYLFFLMLPDEIKNGKKTYLVLLAAPLLHYLTFLVFPDGPLLFFSLFFLVIYKRFLRRQTVVLSVLLGVSLALMAYSKYHGALVLFFTVIANPRLLRSGYFYLSLLVAGSFFVPHLLWQFNHDFPTLKYHLSGRTGKLSFKHVGEYFSQQIVAIGPGLIFLPFVTKTKNLFERTLLFIIIGTFAFFLLSSFKTFVHFHWTSIALFPLLYFAIIYYNNPQKQKVFNWLVLPFTVLFFIARVLLLLPIIPAMHAGEDYYHGRKTWVKEIAAVADSRPVFMPDNLREASLYSFYSGKLGVTLYSRPEKKSQYELWGYEDSLQRKEVMFVTKYAFKESRMLANALGQNLHSAVLPLFSSYYTGISISASVEKTGNDSLLIVATIFNLRSSPLDFSKGLNGEPTSLIISFEQGQNIAQTNVIQNLNEVGNMTPKSNKKLQLKTAINNLSAGSYSVFVGIRNGVLPDAILSNRIDIAIK